MEFNLDPEPFTFNQFEGFATFTTDNTTNTNNSLSNDNYITAEVHFIPAISIKPLPKKTCLLNEHSCNMWKPTVENIIVTNDTIKVYKNNEFLFEDSYKYLDNIKKLFSSDDKPTHIEIHVPYIILPHRSTQHTHEIIPQSISLENSLGETSIIKQVFTNKLASANISPIHSTANTPTNVMRNFSSDQDILSRLLRAPGIRSRAQTQHIQVSHQMQILSQTLQNLINTNEEPTEEAPEQPAEEPNYDDLVQQLIAMGFPNIEFNREAIIRARGDISLAIEFILQSP